MFGYSRCLFLRSPAWLVETEADVTYVQRFKVTHANLSTAQVHSLKEPNGDCFIKPAIKGMAVQTLNTSEAMNMEIL